jgi:AraC-like DNA-binding protein
MTVQEEVKFWRDPDLDNLELLRATYVTHSFSPHVHEGFAIGVVQRGTTVTSYRHAHYDMPAGTVIAINPGELHTGEAGSELGWTYRMLYPKASLLQRIASELADHPRDVPFFSTPVIYDDYLAKLVLHMHLTLEDENSPLIERQSSFWWAMSQLITRHADDPPPECELKEERNCVKKVRTYIETHYAEDILLDQLAALVNLNACHMLRLFTKAVGMPPHAYLTYVRARQAKRLLAVGVPIADAACLTGFVDQSHLTKRFKRVYGITPGQYLLSIGTG